MIRRIATRARRVVASPADRDSIRRNTRDDRHLRAVLAAALARDSRCVDVGANVGGILKHMVQYAPEARHVAIEALPQLANQLRARFPSVDVRAVAVSDHTGEAQFTHAIDEPALSGLRAGKTAGHRVEKITVPVRRLDDLIDFAPTFVKIDVEGAELQVLRGAERVLSTGPIVAFEHSNRLAPHFGTRPEQVHELLTDAGLRIYDMDGEGPLTADRFVAAFHAHTRFNWLARV